MAIINYSGNWQGYLEYTTETISQNISANQSTVRVKIWVGCRWDIQFQNTYGNTVSVTVNGASQSLTVGPLVVNNAKKYLGQLDFVVNHNPNGTGAANLAFSSNMSNIAYGNLNFGNASGSYTHTLATIPRASSVSVGAGVIGGAMAITINRQSNSFTHTLRYAWGNKSGTIASNVGTSHSWTIPNDFANDIPNATSGTGTIFVDTYSGSTKTGTQSVAFSASVPESFRPSLTGFTLLDNNTTARNLIPGGDHFIQIVSNIAVNFGQASGAYGSTISGYYAEIVGRNQSTTANGGLLGPMNYNGSITIRARVTDSRGRVSNTIERTVTVLDYFAPVLSFDVTRSGASSSTLTVRRNARVAPLTVNGSQKNTMTLSFKTAPLNSQTTTVNNGPASGSWTTLANLTNSSANLAGDFPANRSFTVIGVLEDRFTRTEFSVNVATEKVVLGYDKDGRVGIGQIPEVGKSGSLNVAGDIYAGGKLIQQHSVTQPQGQAINITSGSWNEVTETGFYMGHNLPNAPRMSGMHGWLYVTVIKHNAIYAVQQAVDFNGVAIWQRVKHNGVWRPWVVPGLDQFYPVGSIYQSTNATDPATLMGGTWTRFGQGRVLVGVSENESEFNAPSKVGGSKTHTLTVQEMPSHSHRQRVTANNGSPAIRRDHSSDGNSSIYDQGIDTGSTGGGQAHNNLQPYITVYMWQRTA